MSARNFAPLALVALLAASVGCSRQPPVTEPPPVEVIISQAVPPGSKPELIADWDVYTGNVTAKDDVDVRARVNGHVVAVLFKEGDEVKENTPLFELDSEPFKAIKQQAEGRLRTAQESLKFAEEKIALYEPLAKMGSVSKEEVLKAVADKGKAIGDIGTAKGEIQQQDVNIEFCKIKAPIAGKVGEAALTKGDLATATGEGSLLTTIVAVDPMYVKFDVHERAYKRYRDLLLEKFKKNPPKEDEPLRIPVEMAVAGEEAYRFKGVVDFVDNRVNPATGSIKVRAKFDNPKEADGRRDLTAGLFARVRVTLAEKEPKILVADRAILTDQSLRYVLVVNKEKGNKVERVDVRVSDRVQEDGRVAVEGLKGDEWIIVEGVNRARAGVVVNPTEGKMPRRPAAK